MSTPFAQMTRTLALAVACLIALPAFAGAQSARQHFKRGEAAYQQGDYEAAIEQWNKAYALDQRPLLQYNLAQAYERLGRLEDAIEAMDKYLDTAPPDAPYMAEARARQTKLQARLARTGILIEGGEDGATILIDGEDWGRTPRRDPIEVEPGTHLVEVRKEGFETFQARAVVTAGQQLTVTVEMQTGDSAEVNTADLTPRDAEPRSKFRQILPYALMGSGAALAGGGVVLGVLALGKAKDASSEDSSDASSAKKMALGADILMGAGIVAAGVGVTLFVLDHTGSESPPPSDAPPGVAVHVSPLAGPGVVGAHTSVTF